MEGHSQGWKGYKVMRKKDLCQVPTQEVEGKLFTDIHDRKEITIRILNFACVGRSKKMDRKVEEF